MSELLNEAKSALRELPCICQAIGKVELKASRCKYTSRRGKQLWDIHAQLLNQASELSSIISMALDERGLK